MRGSNPSGLHTDTDGALLVWARLCQFLVVVYPIASQKYFCTYQVLHASAGLAWPGVTEVPLAAALGTVQPETGRRGFP